VRRRLTDTVTSLAAQTFPPSRRTDGRVVRDCARDAIDAAGLRAMARETLSVAFAGLRVRCGVSVSDVRRAPWRKALAQLPLPLAAALLCVWTFGFVSRYDHWPLGEGWWMLLGGSLAAVVGAAVRSRWLTSLAAAAVFVAAAAPYVGIGTEAALADTASFFPGSGVDIGAASLMPTLLLVATAWSMPRDADRSVRAVLDRLVLGLLPTGVALVHLLPREPPQPSIGLSYNEPPVRGRRPEPEVVFGDPYPFPELAESTTLLTGLGIALLVAVVVTWRAARTRPEWALATALLLACLAYPVAWVMHGYRIWPTIVVPLGTAIALMLRAAHAAHRSSSAKPASPSEPAASR
jgi:peptidoglycan/LPS O-acetylase OafA/YrhL